MSIKRAKKTIPRIKESTVIYEDFQIQCPHCKTQLQGGFNRNTIRMLCHSCKNIIEIEWDKAIKVNNF